MYHTLLLTHSVVRYLILIFILIVIVQSLLGWLGKKPYTATDNRTGLFLFILTHTQLLIGVILYFVSPFVIFSGEAMKDADRRYWLVEHNTAMLAAIVFITLARTTSKKMSTDEAKHRRLFIFNAIALVIILATVAMSGRGMFGSTF